jgi:hypothetical protein
MSRGTRRSRDVARARVNEIRGELREIYRLFPELQAGRPMSVRRNAVKAKNDMERGNERQPSSRRWVPRRR